MAGLANAVPVVSLSGRVVLDANADGTAQGAEGGFGGVVISLICSTTNTPIPGATATSAANGNWSIANLDLAATCPTGLVRVRATVTNAKYSIADQPGDNQTPRTGNPQIGESADYTLVDGATQMVNTLVRPDWYTSLTIPIDAATNSPAVYTGSGPFDSGCPGAGLDCSRADLTVRTGDTTTFTWAVTASSLDDLSTSESAIVLEQKLNLTGGAIVNFARIPARCKPGGGGGSTPASVIVDQNGTVIPEGTMPPAGTTSVTLRCNLGTWTQTGDAVTLQPVVKVSAVSPNTSSFSTTAQVYGVTTTGVINAVPSQGAEFGPIDVTGAPAYEIEKKGFWNADPAYADIGAGREPGYVTYAVIQLKTNRRVGVEAFKQPVTISEDVFGFLPNGTTAYPGMEYAILQCIPNPSNWPGTVGGVGGGATYQGFTMTGATVSNSGTCNFSRNAPSNRTSDYTLTFSGIDTSGSYYPVVTGNGTDLRPGPYYVASYRVQFFIPLRVIDAADGTPNNSAGSMVLYNRVGGFDPDSVSGASNFGSGREPGYCTTQSVDGNNLNATGMPFCDASGTNTPTPTKSDNVAGPTTYRFGGGSFAKYLLNQSAMYNGAWTPLPGMSASHDGAAMMQPTQIADTHLNWVNTGAPVWHNSRICDVFDNTMASLVPSTATVTGGSPNIYAWLSATGPGTGDYNVAQEQAYNAKWIFEFGHIPLPAGDDPLLNGFNSVSGRYDGKWTNQAAARCEDGAAAGGWQTNPNNVPGGLDAVNAVRVRPGIDPATGLPTTHDFSVNNRLNFGMRLRANFLGGPHDGQAIPAGAVFANFGGVRADEYNSGNWTARSYTPSPENTSVDGDRVTFTSATMTIQKRTVSVDGIGDGVANFGSTGAAVAGSPIIWHVVSSLQTDVSDPAPVSNLTITDILPAHDDYDPDCTASITGGTPADVVLYDTPSVGKTTLKWNLGSWTPNTRVPDLYICTLSDSLAPQGTNLINEARITFDGAVSSPFDTHTVVLDQTGDVKLRKRVDAPLDVVNDDQQYTLSMQNFSETLTIAAPTLIEVFPYNGDQTPPGGVNRNPGSAYHGDLKLTGPASVTNISGGAYAGTFLYTTDLPSTINQNLNLNTSTWLTAAQITAGPGWGAVTGIKFIGDSDLTPISRLATSGLTVSFGLQAGDTVDALSAKANRPNDVYSDRFTAFSSTFRGAGGTFQTLASNRVTVRTVSHSAGDLVFEDRDGDGAYDATRDRLVPDGVRVNLWFKGAGADVQVASTTTSHGTYVFSQLIPGEYYVEIPASEFTAAGRLAGWSLTSAPASPASSVDENDDKSHDAIAGPGGSVISNRFTLSATVSSTGAVTGDEPVGDNLHGLSDPTSTGDAFSNFAIDLGLQQPPGIDLEKEVCTRGDNSCDVNAALGGGGWSTDGVAGVGPDTESVTRPYGSVGLWRIVVTNTGQRYLKDVKVTDVLVASCAATAADRPRFADLAPGASVGYTCTTDPVVAPVAPNTASVEGTVDGTTTKVTDTDTAYLNTTGGFVINKTMSGPGAADFGDGPFTFHATCTYAGNTVVDSDITLTPAQGADSVTSEAVDSLPIGTECTIAETDTGGADAAPAPVTITIVANDAKNITTASFDNAFSVGTVDLAKVLDGSAADDPWVTAKSFEVLVTCQKPTLDAQGNEVLGTLYSGTITLKGGEMVRIVDANGADVRLPIGTRCFAEETDPNGATDSTVDHPTYTDGVEVVADDAEQSLRLTAANTFENAELTISKIVIGPLPDPSVKFPFTLTCVDAMGADYPLAAADAAFSLAGGESKTVTVVAGVTCTATETNLKGAETSTVVDSDPNTVDGSRDGVVAVPVDGASVEVTNTFPVFAVGDLVFEDRDTNGRYAAVRDRLVPDGVRVNLWSGDRLVGWTTTVDGGYLFTSLAPGDYFVEIPASEFAVGRLLEGWRLSKAAAAGAGEASVDENDETSHDAIAGPAGSVISNTFTLSATADPDTGAAHGDEPVGENTHGVAGIGTKDAFANLAIDLALERAPRIDVEKEVCTRADNSCVADAALGSGGWSADGVDGVGPDSETTLRPFGSVGLWRITVTNTGGRYLTDVAVTDPLVEQCAATDADQPSFADFAPGASVSWLCRTDPVVVPIEPNTASVTGQTFGDGESVSDVDTASLNTTGSLVVNKSLSGPGAGDFGTGPFEFTVVCTYAGDEVLNDHLTLTPNAAGVAVTSDPYTGLPIGSVCTVTEVVDGGADQTPDPVTVTIVSNDAENTTVASIDNAFSVGQIEVAKELTGSAAQDPWVKDRMFEVLVTCQKPTVDEQGNEVLGTVYSGTVSLKGGQVVEVTDSEGNPVRLPLKAHCFGAETGTAGASDSKVDYDSYNNAAVVGSSESEQQLRITATNTFDYAEIVVTKKVKGQAPDARFVFQVTCTGPDGTAYTPSPATFELNAGQSTTIQVPTGTTCRVVEIKDRGAETVTVLDSDPNTAEGTTDGIVVADANGATVTVTNTFGEVDHHNGGLPGTGAPTGIRAWLYAGGLLLLVGILLIIVTKRQRRR